MKKLILVMLFLYSIVTMSAVKMASPIQSTPEEIKTEFDNNPARAKNYYSKQPVIIDITIKKISEKFTGNGVFIDDSNSEIILDVPQKKCSDEIFALNPGDEITVIGIPRKQSMGSLYVDYLKMSK